MAACIDMPTSYADALRMLGSQAMKRIGHNTKLVYGGSDRVDVVYHRTSIVVLYADGRVILDHGGWQTRTTLARLSQAMRGLGIGGLTQRKGSWIFTFKGNELPYVNRQTFYTGARRREATIAAAEVAK